MIENTMRITCLFAALLLLPRLIAQSAAPPELPAPQELIDRLVANALLYHQTLPSITASEAIESEASYMIFRRRVQAKGIFRVVRNPATDELEESRQVTEVDGKPVSAGENRGLPWTLSGGFGKFQEMFFKAVTRPCFTFTLLPGPGPNGSEQIAIAEQPEIATMRACMQRGITGVARVDPVTGQLVYMERTVPDEIALKTHLAPWAMVEIAPAKIGDDTFWLPTVVVGTFVNGKEKGKFTAHYSNYHRYTGSIKILPGVKEVEPPAQTPPVPTPAKPPPN
jgi:hypothetical protein